MPAGVTDAFVFDISVTHFAEASPINGIDSTNTDAWNTWFVNLLSLTYRMNVKAICYINANWPSYPGFTSLQWKDARLQNNQRIAEAFVAAVANADPDLILSKPEEALQSHLIVFAAEQARRENRVVNLT